MKGHHYEGVLGVVGDVGDGEVDQVYHEVEEGKVVDDEHEPVLNADMVLEVMLTLLY